MSSPTNPASAIGGRQPPQPTQRRHWLNGIIALILVSFVANQKSLNDSNLFAKEQQMKAAAAAARDNAQQMATAVEALKARISVLETKQNGARDLLQALEAKVSAAPIQSKDISTSHLRTHPQNSLQTPPASDCLHHINNIRGLVLYSQNDEDGALLQTLQCMGGHGSKEYFEFGSENGSEVNTRILRELYGWHGHLLDGSNENSAISLHREYFTPSNIVSLMKKYNVGKELDVLSVDCDIDDFYITREILLGGYRPRVIINEFNINFGWNWEVAVLPKRE
jgi:hypothetical protein